MISFIIAFVVSFFFGAGYACGEFFAMRSTYNKKPKLCSMQLQKIMMEFKDNDGEFFIKAAADAIEKRLEARA